MVVTELRMQPAVERRVDERVVQELIAGCGLDRVIFRRDAGMKVRQRFLGVQRMALRHDFGEQLIDTLHLRLELAQVHFHAIVLGIRDFLFVDEELAKFVVFVFRRQIQKREIVDALEVIAGIGETGHALAVDECRADVGETAGRVDLAAFAPRFRLDAPIPADAAQAVVQSCDGDDELVLGRGIHVGAAIAEGLLERAVVIEDDAILDHDAPRHIVFEAGRALAVFA